MMEDDQPSFLTGYVQNVSTNIIKIRPRALNESAFSEERFKVYLRLKPFIGVCDAYVVETAQTLLTNTPKESVVYNIVAKKNANVRRRFTFSRILCDSTQQETFRTCVAPMLKSLFQGGDYVVMAHGSTSAGKTFTMHGTSGFPGVIPRFIFFLFQALDGLIEPSGRYMYNNSSLLYLNENEYEIEETYKNTILHCDGFSFERNKGISVISATSSIVGGNGFDSMTYEEIEETMNSEADNPCGWVPPTHFSVAISMVEIYNENVIDLLVLPKSNRQYLSVGEDGKGNFFVKNAKYINVRNGHEAFKISQYGRANLHRGSNNLNEKSSRSHCIFSIVVVSHTSHEEAQISRFSFVDLAGSERVKKTLNTGVRLEESKSINKSLTVLGKCIHFMKTNQVTRNPLIVPFRDSKLTTIFKNALTGQAKLTFIVNISRDPKLFDETLQVLNFSSVAQEIVALPRPVRKKNRFSCIMDSGLDFRIATRKWVGGADNQNHEHLQLQKELQEARDEIASLSLLLEEKERKLAESEQKAREATRKLQNERLKSKDIYEKYSKVTSDFFEEKHKERSRETKLLGTLAERDSELIALEQKYRRQKDHNRELLKNLQKTTSLLAEKENDLKEYFELLDEAQAAYRSLEDENEELLREKLDLALRLEDEVRRKALDGPRDGYDFENYAQSLRPVEVEKKHECNAEGLKIHALTVSDCVQIKVSEVETEEENRGGEFDSEIALICVRERSSEVRSNICEENKEIQGQIHSIKKENEEIPIEKELSRNYFSGKIEESLQANCKTPQIGVEAEIYSGVENIVFKNIPQGITFSGVCSKEEGIENNLEHDESSGKKCMSPCSSPTGRKDDVNMYDNISPKIEILEGIEKDKVAVADFDEVEYFKTKDSNFQVDKEIKEGNVCFLATGSAEITREVDRLSKDITCDKGEFSEDNQDLIKILDEDIPPADQYLENSSRDKKEIFEGSRETNDDIIAERQHSLNITCEKTKVSETCREINSISVKESLETNKHETGLVEAESIFTNAIPSRKNFTKLELSSGKLKLRPCRQSEVSENTKIGTNFPIRKLPVSPEHPLTLNFNDQVPEHQYTEKSPKNSLNYTTCRTPMTSPTDNVLKLEQRVSKISLASDCQKEVSKDCLDAINGITKNVDHKFSTVIGLDGQETQKSSANMKVTTDVGPQVAATASEQEKENGKDGVVQNPSLHLHGTPISMKKDPSSRRSRSCEAKRTPKMHRVLRSVSNLPTQKLEIQQQSPSPAKPIRKVKTGKKARDPTEHPALKRGRGKHVDEEIQTPSSVKKQLFSADDLVELSDSDSPLKYGLRPRTTLFRPNYKQLNSLG